MDIAWQWHSQFNVTSQCAAELTETAALATTRHTDATRVATEYIPSLVETLNARDPNAGK